MVGYTTCQTNIIRWYVEDVLPYKPVWMYVRLTIWIVVLQIKEHMISRAYMYALTRHIWFSKHRANMLKCFSSSMQERKLHNVANVIP